MGTEILPITSADIPLLMPIAEAAFADDPMHNAGFPPDMTPAQYREYQEWRKALVTRRLAQSNAHYFKAVDKESQQIMGFAGWHAPTEEQAGERWPGSPDWLVGMKENVEIFKVMKEKVIGSRKDIWFLQAMAVHPDFQGRGIASQLMAAGIQLVDRDGLECYLEATPRATPLYAKHGFVVKLPWPVLDGSYILSAMLRPAKGASR